MIRGFYVPRISSFFRCLSWLNISICRWWRIRWGFESGAGLITLICSLKFPGRLVDILLSSCGRRWLMFSLVEGGLTWGNMWGISGRRLTQSLWQFDGFLWWIGWIIFGMILVFRWRRGVFLRRLDRRGATVGSDFVTRLDGGGWFCGSFPFERLLLWGLSKVIINLWCRHDVLMWLGLYID